MSDARQSLGLDGEALACQELEARGHTVIERRYRTDLGELDIVTTHNGVTVFVEVRTKSKGKFGVPAETVTSPKQQRVVRLAEQYIALHHLENSPCRFDVVSVEVEFSPPRITVFEDAFRPGW